MTSPNQCATIVAKVDAGELQIDISETHPLSEIAVVHEQGASGKLRGKVLLVPTA